MSSTAPNPKVMFPLPGETDNLCTAVQKEMWNASSPLLSKITYPCAVSCAMPENNYFIDSVRFYSLQ